MIAEGYYHVTPIQIRFSDIDRLDHVNNACYLNYFELARVHYFNEVLTRIDWSRQGFVIARTEINHLLPLHLNDDVVCVTRTKAIGNKSVTVENKLFRQLGNKYEEVANGIGILVASDYILKTPIEVPLIWRESIQKFERWETSQ